MEKIKSLFRPKPETHTRVLFVCMGNICRSPSAEAVFRHMILQSPLAGLVDIDSAGTVSHHVGDAPDPRAIDMGAQRGYDLSKLRARQVTIADFEVFDYVLGMDEQNLRYLRGLCPDRYLSRVGLLLEYASEDDPVEVPDPYYGTMGDFAHSLDLIEEGCQGLLQHLIDESRHRAAATREER